MISKKLAILVLNECLATGADFAEIFIEDTNIENISNLFAPIISVKI